MMGHWRPEPGAATICGVRRTVGVLMAALVLAAVGPAVVADAQVTPVPSTPTAEVLGDSSDKDPAQDQLRWLIAGLIVLGAVSGAAALVFWRRTRPPLRVTRTRVDTVAPPIVAARELLGTRRREPSAARPESIEAKPPPVDPARQVAAVMPVTAESLRNVPLWAEPLPTTPGNVAAESPSALPVDPTR